MKAEQPHAHRKACLILVISLLVVWFTVSYGCGILLRSWLDAHAPAIGNAPFGFWMAQQGSIICFVFLLIAYTVIMNLIDKHYGYGSKP